MLPGWGVSPCLVGDTNVLHGKNSKRWAYVGRGLLISKLPKHVFGWG